MHIVKNHLIPFSLAVLLFLTVNHFFLNNYFAIQLFSPQLPFVVGETQSGRYKLIAGDTQKQANIAASLHNGGLLVYGSSELKEGVDEIPYRYFPEKFNIPCLAVGHAGNQSLSILTQLLINRPSFAENTKVVILLSPTWFRKTYSSGTPVSKLFEYITVDELNEMFEASFVEIQFKRAIANDLFGKVKISELRKHPTLLKNVYCHKSTEQKEWRDIGITPVLFVNSLKELSLRNKQKNSIQKSSLNHLRPRPQNWDSLYNMAEQKQLLLSQNNNLYIESVYYSTYMEGQTHFFDTCAIENNRELKDCLLLIEFMKQYKNNFVVVLQPLHPEFYENVEAFLPTKKMIDNAITEAGITYLDMYETDFEKYKPGTLIDIMHLGSRGWLQINRFIIENFYP